MSRTDQSLNQSKAFPIKDEADASSMGQEGISKTNLGGDEGSFANVTHGVYLYYAKALGATQLTTAFIFYIAYQVKPGKILPPSDWEKIKMTN